MKDEMVQDAVPQGPSTMDSLREGSAKGEGLAGMAMLTGPDVLTGLLGLPDSAPPYLMGAGACLLVRSALTLLNDRRDT